MVAASPSSEKAHKAQVISGDHWMTVFGCSLASGHRTLASC